MFHRFTRLALGASVTLGIAGLLAGGPALAQSSVQVTLNGQSVQFNPPPIERAGRVFVPLRGMFEQLGASVVYENGTINATRRQQSISLHIGSTQATVNGQPVTIDVAPFIIGASTYVPLRFISQSLGAQVNYDSSNNLVAINSRGSGYVPPVRQGVGGAMGLQEERPGSNASVRSTRPTIQAAFAAPVDPNSVRVYLDGVEVTDGTTRSSTGFIYAPPSPLQSMAHTVRVTGRDANGNRFVSTWEFTSGTAPFQNRLSLTSPSDGATVNAGSFTVSGRTVPNAHVHIAAGAVANVAGFAFGSGNYSGDTTADSSGYFSQTITLQTVPGAQIGLTVTSTDPGTNDSAQQRLRLHAQ